MGVLQHSTWAKAASSSEKINPVAQAIIELRISEDKKSDS